MYQLLQIKSNRLIDVNEKIHIVDSFNSSAEGNTSIQDPKKDTRVSFALHTLWLASSITWPLR
jgi:hypothetical protein